MDMSGKLNARGEIDPVVRWLGGCVGPRTGPDAVAKRKMLYLCRKLNPGRPIHSPVTVLRYRNRGFLGCCAA
jgi:hypothetical protein